MVVDLSFFMAPFLLMTIGYLQKEASSEYFIQRGWIDYEKQKC